MSTLLDTGNWREESRLIDGALQRSYSYAYKEHLVYGATAMMVSQLIGVYSSLETVRRGVDLSESNAKATLSQLEGELGKLPL